jgi:SagB-type dehydrogenase family enzyme
MSGEAGRRTAPSAGALYPLRVSLVVEHVVDLEPGSYRYVANDHRLVEVARGPILKDVYRAALSQTAVRDAAALVLLGAVFERTTWKYGARGRQYVLMEAGHAAQNLALQAAALGLATVVIGAFDDDAVHRAVGLHPSEDPLCLLPIGRAAAGPAESAGAG